MQLPYSKLSVEFTMQAIYLYGTFIFKLHYVLQFKALRSLTLERFSKKWGLSSQKWTNLVLVQPSTLGKPATAFIQCQPFLQYLAIRPPPPPPPSEGPLFVSWDSRPVTHSFWIGASTTAVACGLSDKLIKTLVRLSSVATFIKVPQEELASVALQLCWLPSTHQAIANKKYLSIWSQSGCQTELIIAKIMS